MLKLLCTFETRSESAHLICCFFGYNLQHKLTAAPLAPGVAASGRDGEGGGEEGQGNLGW